jgi:hypothetical protein
MDARGSSLDGLSSDRLVRLTCRWGPGRTIRHFERDDGSWVRRGFVAALLADESRSDGRNDFVSALLQRICAI